MPRNGPDPKTGLPRPGPQLAPPILTHALAALHKDHDKLVLRATQKESKNLPKWSVLGLVTAGTVKKASGAESGLVCLKYQLANKTLVYDKDNKKVLPLDKYVEGCLPKIKEIWAHEYLAAAGVLPKGNLTAKGEYVFVGTDTALAEAAVTASKLKQVMVCWAMRVEQAKAMIMPVGYALVTTGQIVLKGNETVELK